MRLKYPAPALLFLGLTLPLAVAATAQVTARQGDPSQAEVQDFKSPMILELPFKDVRYLPRGAKRSFKEVERYYCDDLTIRDLVIVKKDATNSKSPTLVLEIKGSVFVRPSYDRLAILRFDAARGEEVFATAKPAPIKASEAKTRPFQVELALKTEDLERLFAEGSPPALLRVAVTVQSDR